MNGEIPCAGTYAWRAIKVLEEDLEVEYKDNSTKITPNLD